MSLDRFIALPRRSRNVLRSLVAQHLSQTHQPRPVAHLIAVPHAFRTVWQERSDIVGFLRNGDEALAYDLRRRFGLGAPLGLAHPVPADLFTARAPLLSPPASIIIPVYKAERAVARLLQRLPATLESDQHVILVNDGSDSPRIDRLLSDFATTWPAAQVITHDRNLGFVAAVNSGFMHLRPDHHAILLNTDTLPPKDWTSRLLAPFADDDNIASVSPLSNNAEILSVPRAGLNGHPTFDLVDRADCVARQLRRRQIELPTGIGFCMAMNRRFLDRLGAFDPAFGRGYGEEVDWCQKAAAIGGRHVVATNLFVGHEGGASFGAAERRSRVAKASRKIAARHPGYAAAALDWECRDPIGPERLAVAIGWAAATARDPTPVFVGHAIGGGAETALQQDVAASLASGLPAVVILRVGGPAPWRVELRGTHFAVMGDVAEERLLHQLLAPLLRRDVVYSCAVRAADPSRVPDMLLELAKGHSLKVRLHDFFPISPSWNLLGSDGRFTGVPSTETTDPAHALPATKRYTGLSHKEWREKWARVMAAASEITAFATSGRQLIEEAYMEARGKVIVRPHKTGNLPSTVLPGGQSIGVLGGINLAKGGAVLERLARCTQRRIVVIGEMDGQFRLPAPHIVHGRYRLEEISALACRYDVGVWFMSSICPETFSFATHEALSTRLPVVGFDLGAQAEALRGSRHGHVLTVGPEDIEEIATTLDRFF